MNTFKSLIETHLKTNRLEKELKKRRGRLIKAYKNKDSSQLYILKIEYTGFAAQLAQETATFDALSQELDNVGFISSNDNEDNYSELMDNVNSDSSSSVTDESQQQSLSKCYNNGNENANNNIVASPVTDNVSMQTTDKTPEPVQIGEQKDLFNTSVPVTDNLSIDDAQVQIEKVTNINSDYKPSKVYKVRCGYKYGGHGFQVFTGYRNKSKPIYTSITLFCRETCNENAQELTEYLIKNGKFKNEMIEEIVFKQRGYSDNYALVRVRGQLSYIKKKVKTLNKAENKYGKVMHIFKKSKFISANDWANKNEVLYVNNFDILKKDTHRKFTNLFLKFGELVKDVQMGLNRDCDPYALVHFREVNDATKCFESELRFGGRTLNIKFSKF